MLINRVGDVCIALGMFVCYYTFKSLDFTTSDNNNSLCNIHTTCLVAVF